MKPIHINLGVNRKLTAIPDTEAHLNGHPILTYSYSIFKDDAEYNQLPLEKKKAPHYLGEIIFKVPECTFEYKQDGNERLDETEVEQLIKEISHYRDNPRLWSI